MKYGLIRKFCRLLVQELLLNSLMFVVPFWNAVFGTQCRNNIESWNNRCILEYFSIASMLPVMQEWFPFNHLQIFTISPIVRIELEAIVIVPVVSGRIYIASLGYPRQPVLPRQLYRAFMTVGRVKVNPA